MIQSLTTDLITQIKNAALAGKSHIQVPNSKFSLNISKVLTANGYLSNASPDATGKYLNITLIEGKITGAKIFSKPGRRWYASLISLPWGQSKDSLIIVSTSKGVMTQREAKKKGIGGEIIAEIF